ncbi:MAG: hypothetical protein ISS49_09610 [Anaerolineae bacterium]|nr:hypothetical protein [Anaerolineae bacterium]
MPTQAQARGRPAVGVAMTFRRKTSPRPRAFRPPAPVEVEKAGRRALSLVQAPTLGIIGAGHHPQQRGLAYWTRR